MTGGGGPDGARRDAAGDAGDADAEVAVVVAHGGLGCARAEAGPASGVTTPEQDRSVAHRDAAAWVRPPEVGFALSGPPEFDGPWLVLRGEVTNHSVSPQTIWLTDAGTGSFHATPVGDGLVRRAAEPVFESGVTPPPALHPEPRRHDLAPGARWPHAVRIALPAWDLRPGQRVRVHWWFDFAGTPLQGEIEVALPA